MRRLEKKRKIEVGPKMYQLFILQNKPMSLNVQKLIMLYNVALGFDAILSFSLNIQNQSAAGNVIQPNTKA